MFRIVQGIAWLGGVSLLLWFVVGCSADLTGPHYRCVLQSDTSYLWWTWTSATGETKETVSRVITGPRKVCR